MKTKTLVLIMMLVSAITLQVSAQDKKKDKEKVTFLVSLTCNNCKNKVEKNIAFEKGVTDLTVNLEEKTVTIEYQVKKTNPEKLKAAIEKLGFEAYLIELEKDE